MKAAVVMLVKSDVLMIHLSTEHRVKHERVNEWKEKNADEGIIENK